MFLRGGAKTGNTAPGSNSESPIPEPLCAFTSYEALKMPVPGSYQAVTKQPMYISSQR